eukprot:9489343-Pyramimonas_sp.AAC.1
MQLQREVNFSTRVASGEVVALPDYDPRRGYQPKSQQGRFSNNNSNYGNRYAATRPPFTINRRHQTSNHNQSPLPDLQSQSIAATRPPITIDRRYPTFNHNRSPTLQNLREEMQRD